jgi:dTDP-4-amino-4,6-dideoxygalactose transaminase
MIVPLFDLAASHGALRQDILAAWARVYDSGQFIMGEDVHAFERELEAMLGVRYVVGLSSGTDALLVALMALGVGPGDEVVTTPLSFLATAAVIARVGARPVFEDVDDQSFNLEPHAAAAACTTSTKALITVHLFGRPAPMPDVKVPVIEDAAQAIGASSLGGLCGCLSFFPSKNLGAMGDAGALYTDNESFADRVRLLRLQGARPKYIHQVVGGNFRLDSLQAAALRVKLPHLAKWTVARRSHAERYRALAASRPRFPEDVRLPGDAPGHVYNQFVVRTPRRDALREHLTRMGVGTGIYYPVPFHLQPCFAGLGLGAGAFPNAEAISREALALPMYPGLTESQQSYVIDAIASF